MHPASLKIIRDEHASLVSMLHAIRTMLERGPGDRPQTFFVLMHAMLFYMDEFPAHLHHPREAALLHPFLLQAVPAMADTLTLLAQARAHNQATVRELPRLLLAWELMGESRRPGFVQACQRHVDASLAQIRLEDDVILPQAERALSPAQWQALDVAFAKDADPVNGRHPADPAYARLYTRIVMKASVPLGMGNAG